MSAYACACACAPKMCELTKGNTALVTGTDEKQEEKKQ